MTYFGFMHGEAVGVGGGLGVTPGVALAYAVVALGFLAVGKMGVATEPVSHSDVPHAVPAE
jgi:AGZA family xanthine/uracil permease-like MFS transporter